jgi:hypothetical protein
MSFLTANRLTDGAVVWLTDGGWSPDFGRASRLSPEAAAEALAAAIAQPTVLVGPYLVDADDRGGVIRREVLRETIRASGPSVGHSKQAA